MKKVSFVCVRSSCGFEEKDVKVGANYETHFYLTCPVKTILKN